MPLKPLQIAVQDESPKFPFINPSVSILIQEIIGEHQNTVKIVGALAKGFVQI